MKDTLAFNDVLEVNILHPNDLSSKCVDEGVDVGAVGLPAALIALCTDVLVFLFEGIVIRNEYLLKESDTKQNAMSKSCKLVAHPVYSTWVYSR